MSSIKIRQWLQDNPDPAVERLFVPADQAAADFIKATYPPDAASTSRERFTQTQLALDTLVSVTGKVRDADLDAATKADMLRNASFVAFPTLAVLLALTIGRIVAYSLVRPLIGLTKAAVNIETMGADERLLDVTLDPPDEIGDLRRAFRSMANAINRREQELISRNMALDAATKRVEAVLNTTEDGIAFIDSNAVFTIVNQPFLQILQIEGSQLLGKSFLAVARHLFRHVRDIPAIIARLRDLVRTPHSNLLMTVYLSGERTRIIRVASVGVRAETAPGAGAEWLGRIITLRDVTRETEVDRMKTEFVSTVSHELRTPLTAIKGYLDLMLDGQAGHITPTQREFLALAGESTDRLTTLINDILDISRIEAGGTRLRRIPTDYRPVVQHVVQMLTGQAKAK
ncbi:MAG: HAMP domain-containing sensor histidine kinase, partial [Armatimonadaceae bacterium]